MKKTLSIIADISNKSLMENLELFNQVINEKGIGKIENGVLIFDDSNDKEITELMDFYILNNSEEK